MTTPEATLPQIKSASGRKRSTGADSGAGHNFNSPSRQHVPSCPPPSSTCPFGCPMSKFAIGLPELKSRDKNQLAPKESLKEAVASYEDQIHQLAHEVKKFGYQLKNVEDNRMADYYISTLSQNLLQIVAELSEQTTTIVPQPPSEEITVPTPPSEEIILPQPPSKEKIVPTRPSEEMIVPHPPSGEKVVPTPPSEEIILPQPLSKEKIAPTRPSEEMIVPHPPSEEKVVPTPPSEEIIVPTPPSEEKIVPTPPSEAILVPQPPSEVSLVPRPPSRPPSQAKPGTPGKPPCRGSLLMDTQTLRTENSRLRRELADARAEVASLSATVVCYVNKEKEKATSHVKWLQRYALDGRIFLYDTVCVHKVFESWSRCTAIARHHRKEGSERKALAKRCVDKLERQQDVTMLGRCFSCWSSMIRCSKDELTKLKARLARMREAKLKAAELAFGGAGEALLLKCVNTWHKDAETSARRRFRKEQAMAQAMRKMEKETNKVLLELLLAWQDVLRKEALKKKRIEQVKKSLGNSEVHVKSQCLTGWHAAVKMEKQEQLYEEQRRKAAEAAAAIERARQQKLAAIGKNLGMAAQFLLEASFKEWLDMLQQIKDAKKKQEDGMSRAMRMIFGQQQALILEIFSCWMQEVRMGRLLRMQESRERIAASRKRALAMVDRTLKESLEALLLMSTQEWRKVATDGARRRFQKEQVLAQALRRIDKQDKEFLKELILGWVRVKNQLVLRKKRLEQVAQNLLNSEAGTKLYCCMAWSAAATECRQERILEQHRRMAAEQMERSRQQKMAAVGRSLGMAAALLLESSWKAWFDLFEEIRAGKRKQEEGMSRAMRMIFGQQQALLAEVVTSWLDELRKGRLARMKEQRERMGEARKRALVMLERSLKGSLEALMMVTTQAWGDEVKAAKKFRKEKEDVMDRVLRNISRTETMWIPVFFGYWEKIARMRRRSLKKGQQLVGHLQNLLLLKFCFTFLAVRTYM